MVTGAIASPISDCLSAYLPFSDSLPAFVFGSGWFLLRFLGNGVLNDYLAFLVAEPHENASHVVSAAHLWVEDVRRESLVHQVLDNWPEVVLGVKVLAVSYLAGRRRFIVFRIVFIAHKLISDLVDALLRIAVVLVPNTIAGDEQELILVRPVMFTDVGLRDYCLRSAVLFGLLEGEVSD